MKLKKDLILVGIMAIVAVFSAGITAAFHDAGGEEKEQIRITASFYPVYVMALNLADGIEDVEVFCMTQNQTGCLHDYQMTTQDMKVLERSDVFLINGGGMEGFLEEVVKNYPSLPVIDTGHELADVIEEGHSHEHGHEEDVHSEEESLFHEEHEGEEEHGLHGEEDEEHMHGNAHFWLNPEYYCIQIQAAADGLSAVDHVHEAQYQKNAEIYISKVKNLAETIQAEISVDPHTGVIVFHDAFVYLAEYLGMEVVHTVDMDGETSLSAGEIAEIMEEVREEHVSVLFTEAQYGTEIADTIGKETGAVPFVIDSLVTGDGDKNSYLKGMEENRKVLKKALQVLGA